MTVPYCDACDRFYNPNTLSSEGNCPDGHHVADPAPSEPRTSLPWHFKLMLAFLILYLGWRFIQMLQWLIG